MDGLEGTVDPWVEGIWGPIQELSKKLMGGDAAAEAGGAKAAAVGAAATVAAAGAAMAAAGGVGLSQQSSSALGPEDAWGR